MNFKSVFVSIVVMSFIVFLIKNSSYQNRNNYEKFLLSKYSNIPNYTEEQLEKIPKPEHPHMSTLQNFYMTLDPALGYVPSERLHDAFIETRHHQASSLDRGIIWNNVPSNMGGRTRAVMFDPNDPTYKKVWAAGVTGGLWYNIDITDPQSMWVAVDDFWDNLSVSRITYDPSNPEIFYVATGEANTALVTYRESSARGIGIWKSIDAGSNWELLASTSGFEYVTDISIRGVENASEIYAAVVSGTYQGHNHQSNPSDGLFKSTDGGSTWYQVLPDIIYTQSPYSPSDIEITSSGEIFIGTMKNLNGEGGSTILRSSTGEVGSWNINDNYKNIIEQDNNNNVPGRVVLASCRNTPEIIYGVLGSGFINNMGFNLSYGNYIIKSIDNGLTWQEVNLPTDSGNEWASLAWHALTIEVNPDDPQTVFIGGLELYRSTNGGNSWDNLSDWDLMYYGGGDRYIHADIHQIAFQPGNNNAITVSSDGGIFFSNNALENSQTSFIERNQGYNTLQFYTCDLISSSENHFVGGLQDNGTLLFTDGELDINDMISGGDGAYCFFDDNDPLIITSTYYNAWYFINSSNNNYEYENNNSGVFINPSDYDSDTNTLYANKVRFNGNQANRIVRITNTANNPNSETVNIGTNSSVYFSALEVSPFSDDISTTLYIGTQSGRLYKVQNVDSSPLTTEIGNSNFPTANISSIDIGMIEDEILVTFSNYGVSSIWLTLDGGDTWEEKESNLPDMPVRWGLLHPEDSNFALIATEIGVWKTSNLQDNNVAWLPSTNGLANVRVDMLSMRETDNMVLVASHGRGLFYGQFNLEVTAMGDLNEDDIINILDVVIMVNLILSDNSYTILADINSDQTIDILDIILLVNMILDN